MVSLIGGFISRWHGGGYFKADKVFKNIAWALPFGIAAGVAFGPVWSLAAVPCLLKATGHGRGFRLHEPMKLGSEPEAVELLIPDKLPLYWYKVSIMALTGLLAVSGGILAFGYHSPIAGLILALGGAFKGVNAMIFDKNTEYREFADGFTAFFALALAYGVVSG